MELYDSLKTAHPLFLIAGPCVAESLPLMERVAEKLAAIGNRQSIPVVFKASYKKANRSSGDSYPGPGLEQGLAWLQKIGKDYGLPLLTDIHEQREAAPAAEVCDILQIPAFLCRQTDLIRAAAATGRIVNIKKGQFMAPEDMEAAAAKTGENHRVLLTERGSSFGYHNLVVDFRSFAIMADSGFPVVYDVTHSLQRPSLGRTSGGNPEYVELMARAAIATGKVKGLFIETHPRPEDALSDAASMLALDRLEALVEECGKIASTLETLP
jgi:2-dehydro-3-deoxyphosphooctonate aldolase (KDO 8-P synthase)